MTQTAFAQSLDTAVLTLADAFTRAIADDPGLQASEAGRDAAKAGRRQAGRLPNPTMDFLTENLSGTGPYRSFDQAETTISLSQTIEVGGDRGARRELAERDIATAHLSADMRKLDLLHDVEVTFVEAQASEETLVVATDRLRVARELASSVGRRVEAARDPAVASARAQASVAEAEAEFERARLVAASSRAKLASYWNGPPQFKLDLSSFGHLRAWTLATSRSAPDIARLEIERERANANIELERAKAIPDPRLSAGFRQFEGTDDTAWVFGISVPLPIWDGNSAAIARARAEQTRASYEIEAGRRALVRTQSSLLAERDAAKAEAEALQSRVIPRGEEAFAKALDGYQRGGFSYLDVLEAQGALTDFRMKRIRALVAFHRAQAALARLTGATSEMTRNEERAP